ncbi:MAG TPA: endonuclease, partial [bacterium]|nr:endonuclease [bacterium]
MAADFLDKAEKEIRTLYRDLLKKHGAPSESGQWKFWCKRPKTLQEKEIIIIESILTQRTKWNNVEKAVKNLMTHKLMSLQTILHADNENIESQIKSCGFSKQKTQRLKNIATFIIQSGGIENFEQLPTELLRDKLLSIHGIGKETADDVLLYAFERPVFVIDEYTKRFVKTHNIATRFSYDFLQQLFEQSLKKDYKLYQDYHALI